MQKIMAMGFNNYPKSVDKTMNILNTFAKTSKATFGKRSNYKAEGTEVAFTQTRDLSKVTCYHCDQKGFVQKLVLKGKLKKVKSILMCPNQTLKKMKKMN